MKESYIESQLVRRIRAAGGLCYKWVSPGCDGVPDRIVILPGGRVIFVELKTETGWLSKIQQYTHMTMRERGVDVRTLYGLDQVKAFVKEVVPR